MKELISSALVFILAAISIEAAPEGFTALFNGNNLEGWWGLKTEDPARWMSLPAEQLEKKKRESLENIHAHWRAEDGILINDGQGLFLTTEQNYSDFELILDYKTVSRADSGVYLRGIPQVQIWDSTETNKFKLGANLGSGGLWNNPKDSEGKNPLTLGDKPFGEWNALRIRMVGEYVTVHLNELLVVDHARLHNYFSRKEANPLPVPRSGPIQLQTHGGEICWRNISIREIDPDEANRILNERIKTEPQNEPEWVGAVENYHMEDGTVQCRKGKGGTLFTRKEYTDFFLKFEFKLPAGGNNGLAIRYPGHGDPAYTGMCELQVLDNTAAKYAKLDPRQYHGSAYGMVAAHRGYLRPTGQWNFQTVEVVGPKIKVELNGTRILDTDLSTVTEFLHNKPHPGKDLTKGHVGFAGHHHPVSFRNIYIKEL